MVLSTQEYQCQLYVCFTIELVTFRLDSLKSKRRKSMSFWENWGGKVCLTIFSMRTNLATFLAVQDSSITDMVCLSLGQSEPTNNQGLGSIKE